MVTSPPRCFAQPPFEGQALLRRGSTALRCAHPLIANTTLTEI
jgi:hypothetical protein